MTPPPARSLSAETPSRRSPARRVRDDLSGGGLQLSGPVGPGQINRAADVYGVENVLHGSGLLNRAPGKRFDNATAAAIGEGQKRLNRDYPKVLGQKPLKIDSLINPDGPTQAATRKLAGDVSNQWRTHRKQQVASDQDRPRPATIPDGPPLPNPLHDDIRRRRDAMTADGAAALRRLAKGLSKTSEPGDNAKDISRAIDTDGLKAIAEFQVIRDELGRIGTREQVRALDKAVIDGVSAPDKERLLELSRPRTSSTFEPDARTGEKGAGRGVNFDTEITPGKSPATDADGQNAEDRKGGEVDDFRKRFETANSDDERKTAAKAAVKALENPDIARKLRDQALTELERDAEKSGMKSADYLAKRQKINQAFPETRDRNGEVKVAALPLAVPIVLGGVAVVGIVGKYVQDNRKELGLEKLSGMLGRTEQNDIKPDPETFPDQSGTLDNTGIETFPDLADEDHPPTVPDFDPPKIDTQLPPFPDQNDDFNTPQIQEIEEAKPKKPGRSLDDASSASQTAKKNWKKLGANGQKSAQKLVEQYLKGDRHPGAGTIGVQGHEGYDKLRHRNGARVIVKDRDDGSADVVGTYLGHTKSDMVEGKIANKLIDEYEKRIVERKNGGRRK